VRYIVCGSRTWTDAEKIREVLLGLEGTIVTGGATGADTLAHEIAQDLGLFTEIHHADWSQGKGGGFARNEKMAALGADVCIAFWDGSSRGTLDMIGRAQQYNIHVVIFKAPSVQELLDELRAWLEGERMWEGVGPKPWWAILDALSERYQIERRFS